MKAVMFGSCIVKLVFNIADEALKGKVVAKGILWFKTAVFTWSNSMYKSDFVSTSASKFE